MVRKLHKYSFHWALLLVFLFSHCTAFGGDIAVLESTRNGLAISYNPSSPYCDSLYANGKLYHVFRFDNHTFRAPAGTPSIPSETIFFAAPDMIVPVLTVSGPVISETSSILLAPLSQIKRDPSGFICPVYEEDPLSYALSGYNPPQFAKLGNKAVIGGIAVWELMLFPLAFDARKQSVSFVDSIKVSISFNGASMTYSGHTNSIPGYIINKSVVEQSAAYGWTQKKTGSFENPFASGEWYRITLSESGMYTISGADLTNAGFKTGLTLSGSIRMFYGGGKMLDLAPHDITTDSFREIAVTVSDGGDGVFDMNDTITFYGESLSRFLSDPDKAHPEYQNYLYADTGENVYWLAVLDKGMPKRIETTGETPSDVLPLTTTYREILHLEKENYITFIDEYKEEAGLDWHWESVSNETKQFSFDAPGKVPGSPPVVRIGFLNGHVVNDIHIVIKLHDVGIKINDDGPFTYSINTKKQKSVEITLPNQLKTERNMLSIWRVNGKPDENIRFDWLEYEYDREIRLNNSRLEFFVKGEGKSVKFKIANALSSAIKIFDTTDPYTILEITDTVYDKTNKTIMFQQYLEAGKTYRFTLWAQDKNLKVSAVTKKNRLTLRDSNNGADYIIVTHKTFMEQASKLASWRSRDSKIDPLTTMVVDVEDIYNEFAWGVYDPTAIRDFLKFAYENYNPKVEFCCLIGDTTSKFKNLSDKQTEKNFIPTYSTVYQDNGLLTDDFFAWFDGNRIPYISTGRLCANDKESAKILVDKIIDYEKNPENGLWHNRILLIADDEYIYQGKISLSNLTFTNDVETLDKGIYIPYTFERKKIMMIGYPMNNNFRKPEVNEDLFTAINEGYLIINFIGHGNDDVLAHEHILKGSRDIERFNNGARQPLFLVLSCSVGKFDRPGSVSLAEMLHLRKNGGCVAIVAPARVTINTENVMLNKSYFRYLFSEPENNTDIRIGTALKLGKVKYNNDNNSDRYVLLGDPATRLMSPRYTFLVAEIDTLFRLKKYEMAGTVLDRAQTIPYTGKLYVKAYGPRIHKTYSHGKDASVDYTMPGNIFYNGEHDIGGDLFNVSLVIPKDLQSDTDESKQYSKESKILLFATGGDFEASGVLYNFYIGGMDPKAPVDTSGPEISFSFDGKTFDDGDYIRRQPTLTTFIKDTSGINMLGKRGHNIKLLIDKTDIIILTDHFKTVNTYTTGIAEYPLPVLSPGEHSFEVTAYDNYNNASKKTVTAQVIGSESGDITIFNLLNYPNPMGYDGTHFTFSLNDDTNNADIKIYSQSGRLVDKIRFKAEYGFNTVFWKPPVELANGVYFYKLTVASTNGRKSSKIEKLVVMR